MKLHLDFESFSSTDLRKVGLENYVASPDFTVTVCAWALDDSHVEAITGNLIPKIVRDVIALGGEIHAWNAAFEYEILTKHFGLKVKPEQMYCTMQRALAYGLPAGLLAAGRALKLGTIKDESKRLLMLSMSRPKKDGTAWHETDSDRMAALVEYCMDDVAAERAIGNAIPDLHPFERRLSLLDGEVNRRGVKLDVAAAAKLKVASELALTKINAECAELTDGEVTKPGSQTAKLSAWLGRNGVNIATVTKAAVSGALESVLCPRALRVLELRQSAARSSVAKLERMLDVASKKDDRARYLLQFYGAGRTGRWAGRLVQPQNLPRTGKGHSADEVIALAEGLDVFYSDPMEMISKTLRGLFVAETGKELVSIDLSQIEARVLAWLAGQQDVVEAFRRGEDVYTLAARKVGSTDRQLGKVLTLACGYGMGSVKFRSTASAAPYYIELSEAEAERHLRAWRRSNAKIIEYWGDVERVVGRSLTAVGTVIDWWGGFNIKVKTAKGVTQVFKPNGVPLTYHNMRWEDGGLVFDGVNSISKKWGTERTYGGRLVENIVQSVARDVLAEGALSAPEDLVLSVHDELLWEKPEGEKVYIHFSPAWAKGLPVAAESVTGKRYAK